MKKYIAVMMLLISISIIGDDDSYKQLEKRFAQKLCNTQGGLMPRDEYFSFIQPYLDQAKEELHVPRYLSEQAQNNLDVTIIGLAYFNVLANCNVACFHHYVANNEETGSRLEDNKKILQTTIQALAEIRAELELDVEDEVDKTITLFSQANKEFYNRLSFLKRAYLDIIGWLLG